MVKPYYEESGITIYHGDCREVLLSLLPNVMPYPVCTCEHPYDSHRDNSDPRGSGCWLCGCLAYDGGTALVIKESEAKPRSSVLVTDPPYGVQSPDARFPRGYASYEDNLDNFKTNVVVGIEMALTMVNRGAVFCPPPAAWMLPTPSALGGIYIPAAIGKNRWGFMNFSPILFYGSGVDMHLGSRATSVQLNGIASADNHPCAKPISWMKWLVSLASKTDDTIIDPFMGSGTTLRAAKDLGRKSIGIEIEEKYCEIAAKRLAQGVLEFA